jgi:hypothetical protein
VSVTEVILTGSGLTGAATGTDAGDVSNTYRATFRAKCSDQLDTPDIVLDHFRADTSLPWIGRRYDLGNGFDSSVICTSVDPQHVANSGGWYEVACRFEDENKIGEFSGSTVGTTASGEASEDPLKWSVEIDVSWTQISEPTYRAKFFGFSPPGIRNRFLRPGFIGPEVNSAGVPYDPPTEHEIHIKVVRITQNFNRYDGFRYDRYQGTVNNNLQVIARPGFGFRQVVNPYAGKMAFYGASLGIENGEFFWRETKEVHIHPRSWIKEIPDRGMLRRRAIGDPDGAGGTLSTDDMPDEGGMFHEVLKDADGFPITEPVLFDGNGQPLEPGKPPVYLKWLDEVDDDWTGIPF